MTEQWVRIPQFPDYEISNLGQIDKIGKTKRIPIKVNKINDYVYASLSYAPYKTKQVNIRSLLDELFEDHIYKSAENEDLPGEVWKDVVGWENSYKVSNLGRIKTKVRLRSGKNGTQSIVSEKIKEAYVDGDGYFRISLYEDNRTKLMGVHRIVAEAFVPNPSNLPQVNHLNGVKTDNRSVNLEWVTNAQNIRHSIESGLRDPSIHCRSVRCLNDEEEFESVAELHRRIGGSYNSLVHQLNSHDKVCINGKHYILVDS